MTPCASDLFAEVDYFAGVWRRWACRIDPDDLRQTVWVAVLEAAERFDPGGGASFRNYARNQVRWQMQKYCIREWRRGVHVPFGLIERKIRLGWSGLPPNLPGRGETPDPPDLWPLAERVLDARELLILRRRLLDDMTLEEVGNLLGLTRQRVQQIEKAAVRKLRGHTRPDAAAVEGAGPAGL